MSTPQPPVTHDALSLKIRGTGPAVLFLHAFPLDSSQWDHQVAALSDRFTCIRVDFWGANGTSVPHEGTTLADFAREVDTALTVAGIQSCSIVGLSLGGYIALELLAQTTREIPTLILANTHPFGDDERMRSTRASRVRSYREGDLGDGQLYQAIAPSLGRTLRSEAHVVDPQIGRMRRWSTKGLVTAQTGMSLRSNRSRDLSQYAGNLVCVGGDEDDIIPASRISAMVDLVPGARLVMIEHAGHFSNLENPEAFTALCLKHLGGETA